MTPRLIVATALAVAAVPAHADPLGDERFLLAIGGFRSDFDTNVRVDSRELGRGTDFGFERDLGLDSTDSLARYEAAARIGDRHRISVTYFDAVREKSARIERTIEFGDLVYDVDLRLRGEFDARVAEILYHYAFLSNDRIRAEALVGVHELTLRAKLAAELAGTGEAAVGVAKASGPLPVVGTSIFVALSKHWRFDFHAQALDAEFGDFDGRVLDLRTGFAFRPTDHFEVALYYNRFDLDLDIAKQRWTGTLDFDYHGPQLTLATRF
ncbi:MAG TPA: hypothetical protein VFL14_04605 [Xanthomonadales bacterium]|nr:hypothetical protein [Xanthomonadales bacterium]